VSPLTAVLAMLAGFAAGVMNAVVGAGTLITFPTLLAAGVPPVTANASNCIGLIAGSASGAIGFRRWLPRHRRLLVTLSVAVAIGAVLGGALLVLAPSDVFATVAPYLIAIGCILMYVPSRSLTRDDDGQPSNRSLWRLHIPLGATGIYGGYFGAAQGVIMLGVLRFAYSDDPREANAIKNLLGMVANTTAGVFYALLAPVDWVVVLLITAGSVLGGVVGAKVGRRLSARALRLVVLVVAVSAIVTLV